MYKAHRMTVTSTPQKVDLGEDRSVKGLRFGLKLIEPGTIFLGDETNTTESGENPGWPITVDFYDDAETADDTPWLVADSDIEIAVLVGGGSS